LNLEAPFELIDFDHCQGSSDVTDRKLLNECVTAANEKFKKIIESGKKLFSSSEGNSVWVTYSVPSYKFEGLLINVHEKS